MRDRQKGQDKQRQVAVRGVYSNGFFLVLTLATLAIGQGRAWAQRFVLFTVSSQTWKYNTNNLDGTGWQQPGYVDTAAAWKSGKGLFGLETNPNQYLPFTFVTRIPNPPAGGPLTSYFRTHFNWNHSLTGVKLTLTNYVDDGVVYYLNGVELARIGLGAAGSAVANGTLAANITEPGIVITNIANPPSLVAGDNVLAAELHQSSATSSDDVFGLSLVGVVEFPCQITDPTAPKDVTVVEGATTNLAAKADCSDPFTFLWFKDGFAMDPTVNATATNATLVITNATFADEGDYLVQAANQFGALDSRTAHLTVTPDTTPPTVVSAYASIDQITITVTFSELVELNTAQDTVSYRLAPRDGGAEIAILGAIVAANGIDVVLTTDPRTAGENYQLTISYVLDRAAAMNQIADNSVVNVASEILLFPMDETKIWSYNQNDVNLGVAWVTDIFNDADWPTGAGVLDGKTAGTAPARTELSPARTTIGGQDIHTTLNVLVDGSVDKSTYYFRTHFNIDSTAGVKLGLRSIVDDSAVFYVNGAEIYRENWQPGIADIYGFSNPPIVPGDAAVAGPVFVNAPTLRSGDNLIAVSVHNANNGSSDITFGLELRAIVPTLSNRPRLAVTLLPNGHVQLTWPAGTLLQSPTVDGAYTPVTGAASPFEFAPTTNSKQFFGLGQ